MSYMHGLFIDSINHFKLVCTIFGVRKNYESLRIFYNINGEKDELLQTRFRTLVERQILVEKITQ